MRQLSVPFLALVLLSCGVEQSSKAAYPSRVSQALSTDLVISEVYGGGGSASSAYRYDFIELFNRGSAPVSLSNKSVQYASETGTNWVVTTLTGTVQPGKYFLIRMGSAGPTSTPNLPASDDQGTTSLSATAGKVALVSNTTPLTGACPTSPNIIDLVGYGMNTNCSEGMSTNNTSASSVGASWRQWLLRDRRQPRRLHGGHANAEERVCGDGELREHAERWRRGDHAG